MAPSFDKLIESSFYSSEYPHNPAVGSVFFVSEDGAQRLSQLSNDTFSCGMKLTYEGDSTQSWVNVYLRYEVDGQERGIYINRYMDLFESIEGNARFRLGNSHHGVEREG